MRTRTGYFVEQSAIYFFYVLPIITPLYEEVALFFVCPQRLHDFFCSERLHDFFVPRACVIFFYPERLHDFFVPRGCVIFCPERLHDFFTPKRLGNFSSQYMAERLVDFFLSRELA